MGEYEPFLINPPKRKPRKRIKYRANDYEPGMEMAAASEMGIGIRAGRKKMSKRKTSIKKSLHPKRRRAAKKAWITRRKHVIAERRKPVAKTKRKRVGKMRKGSLAAKAWGRKMARIRAGGSRKHKVVRRKTTRKRVAKRRIGKGTATKLRVPSVRKRHTIKRRTTKVARRKSTVSGYKRRGFAKSHKRHVVSAYKLRGHMYTSPFSRTVRPMVRLNPFKRRMHHNPFGEELMVVGANPRRHKRRKHSMSNPKRRKVGERKMAKRRRVHRNPMSALTNLIPTLAWATGGAFAANLVPKLIFKFMPTMANPWVGYGIKAATAVGGGMLIEKQFGKNAGESFIIGAVSSTVATVLNDLTTGFFAGLGLGELGDGLSAFPEQLNAFPENSGYDGMGELGNAYELNNGYAY